MRVAPPITLTPEQQDGLQQCARARSLAVRLVERARIVLLAAAGKQDKDIAAELGITAQKAARWRKRFLAAGIAGLEKDAPRPGRTPNVSAAKVKRVIYKTTQEKPAHATQSQLVSTDLPVLLVFRIDGMVHAKHGGRGGTQRGHGTSHLAQAWTEASSGGNV